MAFICSIIPVMSDHFTNVLVLVNSRQLNEKYGRENYPISNSVRVKTQVHREPLETIVIQLIVSLGRQHF